MMNLILVLHQLNVKPIMLMTNFFGGMFKTFGIGFTWLIVLVVVVIYYSFFDKESKSKDDSHPYSPSIPDDGDELGSETQTTNTSSPDENQPDE